MYVYCEITFLGKIPEDILCTVTISAIISSNFPPNTLKDNLERREQDRQSLREIERYRERDRKGRQTQSETRGGEKDREIEKIHRDMKK